MGVIGGAIGLAGAAALGAGLAVVPGVTHTPFTDLVQRITEATGNNSWGAGTATQTGATPPKFDWSDYDASCDIISMACPILIGTGLFLLFASFVFCSENMRSHKAATAISIGLVVVGSTLGSFGTLAFNNATVLSIAENNGRAATSAELLAMPIVLWALSGIAIIAALFVLKKACKKP